ncbi:hypothetical protein PVAG01_09784 [Phlyctema vagabunda]|uniref:Uncharacterized protein n=1 Tax=Phlyctema vagabunda TaxID=108571 RepID=A0ABR4P428_9HELO
MFTVTSEDMVSGWQSSPNVRGTTNILYNSISTIYLCAWVSLCLNLPQPGTNDWKLFLYKLRWHLVTVIFPEVIVATAAKQWLSAKQSVKMFADLGYPSWTIRHVFFANMGAIILAPSDGPKFPIDSQQLAFLVQHGFLSMPQISSNDIRLANKADGFARIIALIQMVWFCLYCVGRGVAAIGLAPLELTTLTFIFCTLHNFFFWFYKPMDPTRREVLRMDMPITVVTDTAGAPGAYVRTPLDFVTSPTDSKSLITPF